MSDLVRLPTNPSSTPLRNALLLLIAAGHFAFAQPVPSSEPFDEPREPEAMTALAHRFEIGDGCPQDAGRAILWYKRAVSLQEPGAMVSLGNIYDEGKCVDQNMGEAVKLFRAASKLGSGEGMFKLGYMIEGARGVRADREEAISWYQKAAEQKYAAAYVKLGELTGDVQWFRKAVAAGHTPAYAMLAAQLPPQQARPLLERGASASDPEAIYQLAVRDNSRALLEKAAAMGHPAAMSRLAMQLQATNPGDSILWFSRAADAGDPAGLTWAAARLEESDSSDAALEKAMEMYQRAVDKGYAPAMTRLATIKADCALFRKAAELNEAEGAFSFATKCKPTDPEVWMKRAADGKHPEALSRTGRTAEAAEVGHKASLLAMARTDPAWVRRAAEANIPEAVRLYAKTFPDPGEAARWYQRAADGGDVPAQAVLARMYEAGQGVQRDEAKASVLYRKAAEGGDPASMYSLGVLTKDNSWIRKAAEASYPPAMTRMGEVSEDKTEALQWLQRSAAAGNANAWTRLGVLTDNPELLEKANLAGDLEAKMRLGDVEMKQNKRKAYQLYRAAADAGYAPAMMQVGDCHMNGEGTSRSEIDAVNWYRQAALAGDPEGLARLKQLGKTQ